MVALRGIGGEELANELTEARGFSSPRQTMTSRLRVPESYEIFASTLLV
jgi:hypothetical protein